MFALVPLDQRQAAAHGVRPTSAETAQGAALLFHVGTAAAARSRDGFGGRRFRLFRFRISAVADGHFLVRSQLFMRFRRLE